MPTYALSRAAGEAALAKLTAARGTAVIGLLSVPSIWARTVGEAPESLFDGCQNIRIGSAQLAHFAKACGDESPGSSPESLRSCIADLYGQAIGVPELSDAVATSIRYWKSAKVAGHAKSTSTAADPDEAASDFFLELSDVTAGE
ncbi:hypothetical protein OWM54_43150 [Myxococcus sp. MISCRS1]|uniref:hypothetical protein n=1 Tax=Myxococcus sp. MISCRS1 TaxID=2996786 RepID=UPI002270B70F|nr:hypothetical protein [Myxococcus sp. MISCRS1]MCY1003964.1 hypothetical protein [Myxococcus sp. MISCRS1]